jgi:hypothetical protein
MTDVVPGWSDDRVTAAFRDRAALRATPAGLVPATMTRASSARSERVPSRFVWAGALAAVLAIAVIAGVGLVADRPSTPPATDAAVSSGQATRDPTSSPSGAASPRTVTLEFAAGSRRQIVQVVDESGRLLRAMKPPQDLSPGRPSNSVRIAAVAGHPEQARISWLAGACDPTTRLTIRPTARTIEVTTIDGPVITGRFCALGRFLRSVILTFDGPIQAEDIAITGQPPGSVLLPLEALGLPVITVEEALRHRDEALDDTELAVAGYWYRQDLEGLRFGSCLSTRAASPILPSCNDRGVWLTASPEPLPSSPGGIAFRLPSSPAIEPVIRNAVSMDDDGAGNGELVLLVGHFDDHRAAICTGDIVSACRGSFVVDVVLDPADPSLDIGRVERRFSNTQAVLDLEATAEAAERVATQAPRGASRIVAAFAVSGDDLRLHEPQMIAVPELTEAAAVWVIRYLDDDVGGRPVVRTKLVIDGPPESLADRVYEVTSSGVSRSGGS